MTVADSSHERKYEISMDWGGLESAGNRNRFNVAATRPERRFIILGNRPAIREDTLGENPLHRYLEHVTN
ncbi:MAG: hypothetical protein J07HQX50_01666 [Haloquadratum sp. J07HQX50]|nr:MAG: hypothetical protein J07HQX50_01666 [Haloquadratum sp. J07HQX50]